MINKLMRKYAASNKKYFYMMSYFAVAIISVAINLLGYGVAIKVIEYDMQQNSSSALENVKNLFDYNFNGFINSAYNVLQSNAVKNLFDNSYLSNWQKTSNIKSISLDLQNVMYGQGFIEESILLSKKKNLCITSTGSSPYTSAFNIYFSDYYDNERQWETDFFDVKNDGLKILKDSSGKKQMFIVYLVREGENDKCVIIKVNGVAVSSNLKGIGENEEEYFITDNDGSVVFSTMGNNASKSELDLSKNNATVKIDGIKKIQTISKSGFEEINYIRTVSSGTYLKKIKLVRVVFVLGYIFCIVIGFVFANVFSELIEKSRRLLLDKLSSRDISMRKYVIRQILVGGVSFDNIPRVLKQNEIVFDNNPLVVLVFDFSPIENKSGTGSGAKTNISEILMYMEQYYKESGYSNVYFCEVNKMCFGIMNLKNNKDDFDLLKEATQILYKKTASAFEVLFVCSISGAFTDVREINSAYMHAMDIINLYYLGDEKSVLCYDDVMDINGCEIDDVSEKKIANYIVLGDKEALGAFICELYDDNCGMKKISVGALRVFTVQLINIAFKTAVGDNEHKVDYKSVYKVFTKINSIRSMDEFKAVAIEYARECCFDADRLKHSGKKYDTIVEYIKDNYSDPMLNGNILADTFKMNRSYLSENFKKYVGEGLADYIVKYRLKKAKELLEKGDAVNKVAISVGFSSCVVFNRAFKKFEGITPTQYKKITN